MSSAPILKQNNGLKIIVTKGPHAGETFDLAQEKISVGRGSDNDICFSNDLKISRNHLEIIFDGQNYKIKNLSEKNRVIMSGQTINSAVLKNNSVVAIGQTEFDIYLPIESNAPSVKPELISQNTIQQSSPQASSNRIPNREVQNQILRSTAPQPMRQSIQQPIPTYYQQNQSMNAGYVDPNANRAYSTSRSSKSSGNRVVFISIILILASLVFYFLNGNVKKRQARDPFVSSAQREFDEQMTQKKIEELSELKDKMNDPLMKKSMEYMTKGLRDYRQKQFLSARDSFAVVLNTDPSNELARKYYYLANSKFDEQIKYQLMLGRRYYETQNYRLCKASFDVVMRMLLSKKSDPSYKEAEENSKKCDLALEGRY